MYRAELSQAPTPVAADTRKLEHAAMTQAQATLTGVSAVAGSIFDAFKGYQEEGLRGELQKETANIRGEMDVLKEADLRNKAQYEQDVAARNDKIEEFRAGAILSGADPEEAKTQANIFGVKQENEIVARFRGEQQRIQSALNDMPQRYHEFMVRSEKTLRNYITQYPGLADSFRNIAYNETGKKGLEFYTINKLYEDVNLIDKQKEAAAKQAQALQEVFRKAYVSDRKVSGVGETQANLEFNAVPADKRLALANASVQADNDRKAAADALKQGGQNIVNFAVLTKSEFENSLLASNANVYAQLALLGVDRTMILSGNVPTNIQQSEQYKTIIKQANTNILQRLDASYQVANTALINAMKNPVDAEKAKEAQNILSSWYDERRKFYADPKNSMGFLQAIASDDPTKLMKDQLGVVDQMVRGLGLPPDVVANLTASGDSVVFKDAQARYPKAASIIQFMYDMRNKISAGMSSVEFSEEMKKINVFNVTDNTPRPASKEDSVGSHISQQKAYQSLQTKFNSGESPTFDEVRNYISSTIHQPANTEKYFKDQTALLAHSISKLSPSERQQLSEYMKARTTDVIYTVGEANGVGNTAKTSFINEVGYLEGHRYEFDSPSGYGELKITADAPDQYTLLYEGRVKTLPYSTKKTNAVLSHIDEVLRMRSQITGEPVNVLRQEFMKIFDQNGLPSENFVKPLVEAVNKAKTHDGYPARLNADGTYSTEVSITVTDPRLNDGKPTNIPSLWKGKEVSEDEAVKNALATGKIYPSFSSIDDAVKAAEARSEDGGAASTMNAPAMPTKQIITPVEERNRGLTPLPRTEVRQQPVPTTAVQKTKSGQQSKTIPTGSDILTSLQTLK